MEMMFYDFFHTNSFRRDTRSIKNKETAEIMEEQVMVFAY